MNTKSFGGAMREHNGKVIAVNELFFANLIRRRCLIKYVLRKKVFFQYEQESGSWIPISRHKLQVLIIEGLQRIYDIISEFVDGAMKKLQTPEDILVFICLFSDLLPLLEVSRFINTKTAKGIIELLKGVAECDNSHTGETGYLFHAENMMVMFNEDSMKWEGKPFSPNYHSHDKSTIIYDPDFYGCPKFLNQLIKPAMTNDDIEVLQLYLGQCLLGVNLSQALLVLTGVPGGGKTTLVNIIEKVIGKHHCAELRASLTTGRFEMGSLRGKRLLTGKDVSSEYMNNAGARALKVLTGNDSVTAEYKNSNKRFNFDGCFNIIITSNNTIKIKFDGDLEAWRRRILIIKYENKPPKKKIANFDDVLIAEEGPAILNWIMEGAVKLIRNGSVITKTDEQKRKVNRFLQSSDPFTHYAKQYIHRTQGAAVTTAEVVEEFYKFCKAKGWDPLPERDVQKQLKSFMAKEFGASITHGIKRGGKSKRGYRHFQIREKNKE